LSNQNFDQAKFFWRERLKGFAAPTPLIATNLPTENLPGLHAVKERSLSRFTTGALQALARENELTLNTLVQTAWALLLSRYSGEEDVVFGATRACRHSSVRGVESTVGLFINTLPVRVKVKPESELLPWLKEVRSHWITLREFEHTPLVEAQQWSDAPGEKLLFDSIVVFENSSINAQLRSAGGAWLNREFRLVEQPSYPLTLAAYGGDELLLKIFFDRTRFDDDAVVRMLGHLNTLLAAIAENPRQQVCELPLLTEAEKRQLLVERNQPQMNFPPGACLHQLFEAQVEQNPDAVAIAFGDDRVSYGEVNRRADLVAERLRKHGVRAETLVAICMERSIDLIVGILGILKAGGAYLPIDPAYPQERMSVLLGDSRAPVLLTQHHQLPRLPSCEVDVICIDAMASTDGGIRQKVDHRSHANPDSPAYVIYTSGSTAKPKGVMVTHHNVVRLFQGTRHWFHFDHTDVWTLFHSPSFDFSVWEIWGALLHGGKLVIVPHAVTRAPEMFCELLAREKVTVLNQTPSAFRQLIRAEQELAPETPLALRWIIFGGEALDLQSLKPWFDRHGDDEPRLVNMYGITETTVHVTYRRLKKGDVSCGSVIGSPIPDLQLYILDSRRQPVPIGVPGEIYVGGAGLARGYLHRPDLTEERFVPHPFSNEPGARLYKTGDRARFLPGCDIEYLGRVDDQIKIRGFRIEPREIKSVLGQHPLVREAAVVVREDKADDKRLVAYAVTRQPAPSPAELRRFLQERLPDYMLPSAIVVLDKLPLTANDKLDRRALPPPDQSQTAAEFVAPRTTVERTVAGIWQELLGVRKVGLHDNFFEMGGHSLLLAQLHHRLQATLHRNVPITALFQYPTLNALAKHLSESADHPPPKVGARVRRIRELQEASVV
jgi:amino acid adenylation domain-containing protein